MRISYSVHPGVAMLQRWRATLPEKTGRSLERWLALVRRKGPKEEASLRVWLKEEHGLGTNSAAWIAERALGASAGEEDTPEGYLAAAARNVEEMYAGPKAALRPLHDALLEMAVSLGDDVRICPGKTIVPLYRHHVFAQLKPAARTRIDFGLALGDQKATGRLIDTGGFAKKDRITHRFEITKLADIDATVLEWTRTAYQRDTASPRRGKRGA